MMNAAVFSSPRWSGSRHAGCCHSPNSGASRFLTGQYNQSVEELADASEAHDRRLAVYGTLAPGRVNHHQISALAGNWKRGTVKGKLLSSGWGAALGFPGLILD